MLNSTTTKRFDKDYVRQKKRAKELRKLHAVMQCIIDELPLEIRHRDHALSGDWIPCRDCHIESDWLLIYRIDGGNVIFERTGSHADIFG